MTQYLGFRNKLLTWTPPYRKVASTPPGRSVNFGSLNEHRFRHNFECLSPMCICGAAKEDTDLLHCPQFNALRHHLLGQVLDVGIDVARMSSKDLCNLLLYGKPNGSTFVNRIILEAIISFMES